MKSASNNYFKSLCNINFNIDVESQYHLTEIVNKLYFKAINQTTFGMHFKVLFIQREKSGFKDFKIKH